MPHDEARDDDIARHCRCLLPAPLTAAYPVWPGFAAPSGRAASFTTPCGHQRRTGLHYDGIATVTIVQRAAPYCATAHRVSGGDERRNLWAIRQVSTGESRIGFFTGLFHSDTADLRA